MRAARLYKQGPIESAPLQLEDCPDPQPGRGEVRLLVKACGACHTDLHIVEGDLPLEKSPLILGHQIVGVIDMVGDGVSKRRLGDRVGVPWINSSCGTCDLCVSEHTNLCAEARFTGYDADGGYAEHAVVPEHATHLLPDLFSDVDATPLLCAGIIGYRSLKLAGLQPGQRLGLYGFGASAHLAIQVAQHWGCDVFVSTRSQNHRELAHRLGAVWIGGAEEQPPEKLDAAITFAPVGWIIREALAALAPGGTVAINAIHLDAFPVLDYREHLYGERTLRSVTNLTHRDAEEFLEIAATIPIITTVEAFDLQDANMVLLGMKESRIEAAAALVP